MATTRKTKTGSTKKSPPKPVQKATAKRAAPAKRPAPAKRATAAIAKKPAARKPAAQAKPARTAKTPPITQSRTVVRKSAVKRGTSTEAPVKKGPPSYKLVAKKPVRGSPHFSKRDLNAFKRDLLSMRERITGQSGAMRHAALQRTDETNPEEDGTNAFMRLQTLEQVSSQLQTITNIDEALRSIEKGNYGVCDTCGELISKLRLAVLPFAKNCIRCQSEMEKQFRFRGRR